MVKTIFNSERSLFSVLLLLGAFSSASGARGLRSKKEYNPPKEQSSEDGENAEVGWTLTQSECLSMKYPYTTTVVDALHAQVAGRETPLVASSIDEANEIYKLVAGGIREADKHFPREERPRFLCLTAQDDMYCARNCEYFDLVDRDFCQAGEGSTWVANWADKELQGPADTRFRILKFDPYNMERPLGDEIIHVDEVGRGFAEERYFWHINGWILDPPSSQEGCIGCVPSVPTETYTRAYTLAGGNPTRQGIAVAGVTLPQLPETDTTPISDPQDPEFIHPMYARINAVCPCC